MERNDAYSRAAHDSTTQSQEAQVARDAWRGLQAEILEFLPIELPGLDLIRLRNETLAEGAAGVCKHASVVLASFTYGLRHEYCSLVGRSADRTGCDSLCAKLVAFQDEFPFALAHSIPNKFLVVRLPANLYSRPDLLPGEQV